LKLATWNVNSLAVRLPQLLDWLAANPVDVIVLQETKLTDDEFPHAEIAAAGYQGLQVPDDTMDPTAVRGLAGAAGCALPGALATRGVLMVQAHWRDPLSFAMDY
jgi:hypothetical protein